MSKKKDSLKPWLSRPAINRSVTLPLTRPLTQRLSNLNEFHPNELDPYLLFDARDSMIGTLENPTLDLDPSQPDTLNVITATRAGVATYTDAAGLIQSADPDTVRVDHVDGVPMILVEPSSENLVTYSEDFSNAGWSKVFNVVVTPSSVDAPDGTTNAFKLSELQLTDGDYGLSELLNTTPSASYTFSAYFKATSDGDVGKKLRIRIRRNTGTAISATEVVTLTSEWVRHSVTIDLLSDNTDCWFVVTKDTSSPTASQAEECLIWGAQVETGSVATSYIPTSGSTVTRAADDLVISGSDFSDFYNGSEGTVYVEYEPRIVSSSNCLFNFSDGTSSHRILSLVSEAYSLYISISSNLFVQFGVNVDPQVGTLNQLASSFKTNDARASLNGAAEVTDTSISMPTITQLNLGTRNDSTSHLNGHIKRLIYWPYHSDSL